MKRVALLLSLAGYAFAASPFAFRTVDSKRLELTENGKPVYVYNFGPILAPGFPEEMSRSTYLHPVYAPDGTLITDDFNKDHPHHRGISWMWPVVKVDGKTYDIWTVQGMKERFVKWTARDASAGSARLGVENGWYMGDRKVVKENVEIVTWATKDNGRRMDFTLRFEATGEPVEIAGTPEGNKGFGGFCFRLAPRDGGSAATVITTDHGVIEKDGVMERTTWAQVSGRFQGREEAARLDDDASNPGYPKNGWLLRHGFGFMNPSWPGMPGYTLKKGAPLVLKYHVALQSGASPAGGGAGGPTSFLDNVERTLLGLSVETGQAEWVKSTYITDDTEAIAARADEKSISATVKFAKDSTRFDGTKISEEQARKIKLLKLSLTLATPADPRESEELTRIVSGMEGTYGKGKYCPEGPDKCRDLEQLSRTLATSRNAQDLLEAWRGWHTISRPMRKDFVRYVELANKGARELGFADNGAMWRSKYDMPPDAFAKELDRLWEQVRPLYLSLHAYVRARLRERYGDAVPASGPIPAHLLGNMWAQEWENIYPLVAPQNADPGYDLTEILKSRNTDWKQMVQYGERFFTSLGFDPLPQTFWERSLFLKPRDREVVCHASAWDVDAVNDLRLKMCIQITGEDFNTIHHELGHNFYQRAYNQQPYLFRDSANDGFHEAVGDTIALSVTPEYLVRIGLLKAAPDTSKDIGLLLHKALEKIAFLPFGLVIDQWRWKVFSGEIKPADYNRTWWELRRKYQGVAPSVERTEEDFDPGAKFHVAANVPYTRYFLADILQFQFHRSLTRISGCTGPLNRCSIYGNQEAGRRLNAMLAMGQSRPWPEALAALTGQREMDATAIRDYFAPLQKWLDEQNRGKPVGW